MSEGELPAAAGVASNDDEVVVVATSRGPSYTSIEDLSLCKAFIRSSEGAVVGANQRSNQFKAKFHDNYKAILKIVNERNNGAFNRFSIGCLQSILDWH